LETSGTTAQSWRLPDGEPLRRYSWSEIEGQTVDRIRFFPRANAVLSVTEQGRIYLQDLEAGELTATAARVNSDFKPDHLSPDRRWLLGVEPHSGNPGVARLVLWDLDRARQVPGFDFHFRFVHAAAFDSRIRRLAFSLYDLDRDVQKVAVWDLDRNRLDRTLGSVQWPFSTLAFSSDADLLAGGNWESEIHVWELPAGRLRFQVKGHIPAVASLNFSSDGRTLCSSGADFAVRFWNVTTGREMLVLQDALQASGRLDSGGAEGHYARLVSFFPGDRWFVWQDLEGRIHVTSLPTLAEIDAKADRSP
jgi:WD40 repeat protein